ncbi:zinc c2h2 type family protein, partial [Lasius niger]
MCPKCNRVFTRPYHLKKRLITEACKTKTCSNITVPNANDLQQHNSTEPCQPTDSSTKRKLLIDDITEDTKQEPSVKRYKKTGSTYRTAHDGRLRDELLQNEQGYLDIKQFLESKREDFKEIITSSLETNELKVNLKLICIYERKLLYDTT